MKEFLTPEIIAIAVIAAMIIVAVFFAFVANKMAGIDGKVTDLTEDVHKQVEKQINVLAQGLHAEVEENKKDLKESLNQMGDTWRSTLDKTVSDVQGEIGKLKSDISNNSTSLQEAMMKVITDNAVDFNEQVAFVRDTHGKAIQDYQQQLAQQVREHAKGERELLTSSLNEMSSSFGSNMTDLAKNQKQVLTDVSSEIGKGYDTLAGKVKTDIDKVTGDARKTIDSMASDLKDKTTKAGTKLSEDLASITSKVDENMGEVTGKLDTSLADVSTNMSKNVTSLSKRLTKEVVAVTGRVDENMVEIGDKIDSRIKSEMESMLKLFKSFADRVEAIEQTREHIEVLAGNVNVLATVLDDRRGRGNLGNLVIESIVKDNLPPSSYEMNATLSNGVKVDCLLRLPDPSGMVAVSKVDAQEMETILGPFATEAEVEEARQNWHGKLKEAVKRTATECVIEGETAEGAILLMPTESAFSETHVHHRDLVDEAYKNRVWIASPSTLIAMVTVARSVIKDARARNELEETRKELVQIESDYNNLEDNIQKLTDSIDDILTNSTNTRKAARKISNRINHVNGILSRSETDQARLTDQGNKEKDEKQGGGKAH